MNTASPCTAVGLALARAAVALMLALAAAAASAATAPAIRARPVDAPASAPYGSIDGAPAPRAARRDPLDSPACRRAIAALDAQEAAAGSAPRASVPLDAHGVPLLDPKLAASRRRAAASCLARRADPPAEAFVRPVPILVAPLAAGMQPAPASRVGATAPPVVVPEPARPAQRPYAITSCDAGGCWANDGSRLNRVGPNLWGPRGVCTVQGTLLQCP